MISMDGNALLGTRIKLLITPVKQFFRYGFQLGRHVALNVGDVRKSLSQQGCLQSGEEEEACRYQIRITIHRSAVSTFHDPGFFRHSLLPRSDLSSSLVARSSSLSRLSFVLLPGAGSCSLHAPPKSKICPLWLILPYQTPGTENSQTVTQKIHKQNTQ
ncbi:hypothetical protein TNCV_2466791 [Trichonephila clavipes]|nr:hypothetical protein TNCV_2466791 [Trichonephila clavipes]